jgi:hypothetical protein
MKKFGLSFIALCLMTSLFAQDIEVKKFGPLEKDQTAVTSPRKDINGNTCGVVKVALKEAGAEFEGNVMGDVEFTGKEYLVYLPNGTKRLGIKHPDYLPTTIVFADYGTKRVSSGTTYQLTVKTSKKTAKVDNSKKGMAVFNIKPSNAMLLIDGQIADGSGGAYTLSLPYGTHYYTVKLKDFSINNQMIKVDKNAKTVDVDLTEYFTELKVDCIDKDAEIEINGEPLGIGTWAGSVLPGNCVVSISKKGYHSQSKTVELKENDIVELFFPKLDMITGTIVIDYKPVGSEVLLNDELIGKSPLKKVLPVGDYNIVIRNEYYVDEKKHVIIRDKEETTLSDSLVPTPIGRVFIAANNGDYNAQMDLANCFYYGYERFNRENVSLTSDIENSYYKSFSVLKKNTKMAWEWALKASENVTHSDYKLYFNQSAFELLMEIYLRSHDYVWSFKYAQKAYDSEHKYKNQRGASPYASDKCARNSFWLAWHYYYGKGTTKNYTLAVKYIDEFRTYHNYSPEGTCSESILNKFGVFWYSELYSEINNL